MAQVRILFTGIPNMRQFLGEELDRLNRISPLLKFEAGDTHSLTIVLPNQNDSVVQQLLRIAKSRFLDTTMSIDDEII